MTREERADLEARLAAHDRNTAAFAKLGRTLLSEFCAKQAAVLRKRLNEEKVDDKPIPSA